MVYSRLHLNSSSEPVLILGTIDNLNGLLTMNKIANIEVNVDELTTTSNLNGLLTFNLHYSPHLQPAQPTT